MHFGTACEMIARMMNRLPDASAARTQRLIRLAELKRLADQMRDGNRMSALDSIEKLMELDTRALQQPIATDEAHQQK